LWLINVVRRIRVRSRRDMAWITGSLEPRKLTLKNPPQSDRSGLAVPPELVLRRPVSEIDFYAL